jgi:hypothetical protein
MPYVLPKGSSKIGTTYDSQTAKPARNKDKRRKAAASVNLPEPVKIPPPLHPAVPKP